MNIKKAQTATEYLIILAVVIVIALIVVGVLGGIPSIGGGAGSNTASSYWRTATIGVDAGKVQVGGTAELTFRNNRPGTITITNVTFGADTNNTARVVASGSTVTYTFVGVNGTTPLVAGESFEYPLSIIYTDAATNAQYTFSGDGNRFAGTVAN